MYDDWEVGNPRRFKFDPNSTKNQGRWRLRHPTQFDSMAMGRSTFITRHNMKGCQGKGVSFIVGKIYGKEIAQAVRFDRAIWSEKQAAEWWKKNSKRLRDG